MSVGFIKNFHMPDGKPVPDCGALINLVKEAGISTIVGIDPSTGEPQFPEGTPKSHATKAKKIIIANWPTAKEFADNSIEELMPLPVCEFCVFEENPSADEDEFEDVSS